MTTGLTSRERLLCAMHRAEPDHVPLWNLWRNRDLPFAYRDQVERAEQVLALGLDDTLLLQPPLGKTEHFDANRAAGIAVHCRPGADADGPILLKEYDTPEGPLRQIVRRTDDWPYGEDVRLFSDHNVSRSLRFPVVDEMDLARLRYVLAEPSRAQLGEFRERAAMLRAEARRLGVVLEGGWTALGDAALWLLGTEGLLYGQMDRPRLVGDLLDIVCAWELRRLALLLDEGVDVVVHSAWYESTDFWTVGNFRQLLMPRLAQLVDATHQAGALFSYIVTTSWAGLVDSLLELGIDSIVGVDPVQGKASLAQTKERLGGRVCLWGGVNGALTLGRGTPSDVERATEEAIRILAPGGGYVLYAVDQLVAETPWSNVEAMIGTWRRVGAYPVVGAVGSLTP